MTFGRIIPIISLFFLASCSSNLTLSKIDPLNKDLVSLEVPFFPQPAGFCGPAALASVLNYWGGKTTPDEISNAVYLKKLHGTLRFDLTYFARKRGFMARTYRGNLSDLEDRLSKGIPLLTFLNLGTSFFPVGHFLVVTGIALKAQAVVVHSGSTPNALIPFGKFIKAWEKGAYWTLEITPPGYT